MDFCTVIILRPSEVLGLVQKFLDSRHISPIFTELSTRFAQNDQPVTHRGVDDKLHDLFRA